MHILSLYTKKVNRLLHKLNEPFHLKQWVNENNYSEKTCLKVYTLYYAEGKCAGRGS